MSNDAVVHEQDVGHTLHGPTLDKVPGQVFRPTGIRGLLTVSVLQMYVVNSRQQVVKVKGLNIKLTLLGAFQNFLFPEGALQDWQH